MTQLQIAALAIVSIIIVATAISYALGWRTGWKSGFLEESNNPNAASAQPIAHTAFAIPYVAGWHNGWDYGFRASFRLSTTDAATSIDKQNPALHMHPSHRA